MNGSPETSTIARRIVPPVNAYGRSPGESSVTGSPGSLPTLSPSPVATRSPSRLIVAFAICLVFLGVAVTALCRTAQQTGAFTYLGMVLFGAIGGAFVPFNLLPGWA